MRAAPRERMNLQSDAIHDEVDEDTCNNATPSTSSRLSSTDNIDDPERLDDIITKLYGQSKAKDDGDGITSNSPVMQDEKTLDTTCYSSFATSRRRSMSDSDLPMGLLESSDCEDEPDSFDISIKSDELFNGTRRMSRFDSSELSSDTGHSYSSSSSRPRLERSNANYRRNVKRRINEKTSFDTRRKSDFGMYKQRTALKRKSFERHLKASINGYSKEMGVKSQRNLNATQDTEVISLIAKQLRCNFLFLSLDDETIVKIAQQFQVCEYEPGVAIFQEGDTADKSIRLSKNNRSYFYILVEGECVVLKDNVQIHGKYGIIEKGTSFGEDGILFGEKIRASTIVASVPSPETGTIVVYRLEGSIFDKWVGIHEKTNLQTQIKDIQTVINVLSGVDTKTTQGTIIQPYKPNGFWLWKQWTGTVLQYVWWKIIRMMAVTALFGLVVGWVTGDLSPDAEHDMVDHLLMIGGWWSKLSPLTTFVSTFFLNEGFKFWKRFYWSTRGIQGRFNDISLILASNVKRRKSDGDFTDESTGALDDIAHIQSLLHKFYWCSVVKRYQILLSPVGLSYLQSKKLISQKEFTSLIEVGDCGHGLYNACMTWLVSRIELAIEREEIKLSNGATTAIYDKITNLRMLMARLPDMYDGRMPLAYIHFVHLSVSVLVWLSPIALFPLYWFWSIIAVGFLTLFYQGIFTLTLMFLDPVDNDKLHQTSSIQTVGFDVGVLIRESNNGAIRYKGCAAALPQY